MSQQIENMIREAYAAFGRGDVDGYLHACADDFLFHVPGTGGHLRRILRQATHV